jgi:SAM-dependent methyltransferase
LDLFERIVVLDICPELLAIGEENARLSFTPAQTAKISWVVLDINDKDVRSILAKHLHNDLQRGFDTISFSYSLSMIPAWEQALLSARSLMSADGRVIVSDFDTYTEAGKSFKDFLIRTWYRQDGVRIESKSRDFIANNVFGGTNFAVTMARFQRKLGGVKIPHYVACCRKETVTESDGKRRPSAIDLTALGEEKKTD